MTARSSKFLLGLALAAGSVAFFPTEARATEARATSVAYEMSPEAQRFWRYANARASGAPRAPDHLAAGELPRAERGFRYVQAFARGEARAFDHVLPGDIEALLLPVTASTPAGGLVADPSRLLPYLLSPPVQVVLEILRSPPAGQGEDEIMEAVNQRDRESREREAMRESVREAAREAERQGRDYERDTGVELDRGGRLA